MEVIDDVEEQKGVVIGVTARKLPPDYESKVTFGPERHIFREFVVEVEDYRVEEMEREAEWKRIKKKMATKK